MSHGHRGGKFGGYQKGVRDNDTMKAGLPFAGIPPEMKHRVDRILKTEPEHRQTEVEFDYKSFEHPSFSLLNLIQPILLPLVLAFVLVIIETVTVHAGPLLTKYGIDQGVLRNDFQTLFLVCLLYIGTLLINALISYFRVAWTGRLAEELMFQLRIRAFTHLQKLSIDFYTEEMSGRIMTRMTSDIEALTVLFHEGIINLFVQMVTLIFVTVVLFILNVKLALMTVLFVAPMMLALTLWFRKVSYRGYLRVRDRIADVLADFQENLTGLRIIKALNRQKHNIDHHYDLLSNHKTSNLYTVHMSAIFDSGSVIVSLLGQTMILFIGGRMFLASELTIGELTAFILYMATFFAPINQLVQLYNTYQRGQAALTKLGDVFSIRPMVCEKEDAIKLSSIEGKMEFRNVSFGYQKGSLVVENINLFIAPGETIAFVGQTGAGKSTIAKLIMRFHDPTEGQILIDGHDIRNVTVDSLRKQIGYVPQEPFLFAGTIRDNIAFAKPGATDEDVRKACQQAGIAHLFSQLDKGIYTAVHERGSSLSSGERQLIALARAFLAGPKLVVLDEATSNLDLASESKIQNALKVLLKGRTSVIIAHRMTTAMRADRIAVFRQGRLVELGSHDELLGKKGNYVEMYETWAKHLK